jgi:hypothetical protein
MPSTIRDSNGGRPGGAILATGANMTSAGTNYFIQNVNPPFARGQVGFPFYIVDTGTYAAGIFLKLRFLAGAGMNTTTFEPL